MRKQKVRRSKGDYALRADAPAAVHLPGIGRGQQPRKREQKQPRSSTDKLGQTQCTQATNTYRTGSAIAQNEADAVHTGYVYVPNRECHGTRMGQMQCIQAAIYVPNRECDRTKWGGRSVYRLRLRTERRGRREARTPRRRASGGRPAGNRQGDNSEECRKQR
jgi:hypothetical protein